MPFSPIQDGKHHIQYSDIPGETMRAAGLKAGEIAINTADAKMYMRAAGGNLLTFDGSVSPYWGAFGNELSAPAFIAAAPTSGTAYNMGASPTATISTSGSDVSALRDIKVLNNGDVLALGRWSAARYKLDGTLVWSRFDFDLPEESFDIGGIPVAELDNGNIVILTTARLVNVTSRPVINELSGSTGVVVAKDGYGFANGTNLATVRFASLKTAVVGNKAYFGIQPNTAQTIYADFAYEGGVMTQLPFDPASGVAGNFFTSTIHHPNGDVITYSATSSKVRIWKWNQGFVYADVTGSPDVAAFNGVGAVMDGADALFIAGGGKKALRVSPDGSGGYTAVAEATRTHSTVTNVNVLQVNASGQLQCPQGTFDATGVLSASSPVSAASNYMMPDGSVAVITGSTTISIVPPPSGSTFNYDYWRKVTKI